MDFPGFSTTTADMEAGARALCDALKDAPAEAFAWEHYCLGHTYTVFDRSRVICECGSTFGYADSGDLPWWNLNPAWQGPYLRLLDRLGLTPHVARLAAWLGRRLERSKTT